MNTFSIAGERFFNGTCSRAETGASPVTCLERGEKSHGFFVSEQRRITPSPCRFHLHFSMVAMMLAFGLSFSVNCLYIFFVFSLRFAGFFLVTCGSLFCNLDISPMSFLAITDT